MTRFLTPHHMIGSRQWLRYAAYATVLLMLAGFGSLLSIDLIESRQKEYDIVRRDCDNLTQVLERQIMMAVEKTGIVLGVSANDFRSALDGTQQFDRLEANLGLDRMMAFIPEAMADSLRVIDAEGRIVFNAGASAALPDVTVGDRAYFLRQKSDPAAGLLLSEPLQGRLDGTWLINLSRRISAPDGRFLGVVQAALPTDYFQSLFSGLDIGKDGSVALIDTNRRLLARYPARPERIGTIIDSEQIRISLEEGRTTGSYETESRVDGVRRLFTFRKIDRLPYLVIVGRAHSEFIEGWQRKEIFYNIAFLGLSLALLSFLYLLQRHTEENRRLVNQVFDASREGIVVTDAAGKIIIANAGFTAITGYTQSEVIGQNTAILRSGRHGPDFYKALWDKLLREGTWRGEIWNRRKSGEVYPQLLSISALRTRNGVATHYIGLSSDITELQQARQQAEAGNLAKSEFLATMSHEIRTPMNGVIGMTGLLLDTKLTEEQRIFAQTIRESSESLLSIINDILDLSKMEASRLDFEETSFEIRPLVEGVIDILSPRVRGRDIDLTCLIPAGARGVFRGDPGRLRQVLLNLVGNAVKFTESGTISIVVAVADGRDGRTILTATVTDTGIGIPDAAKPRMFDTFTQADASMARRFGGSGLGLAICKRIVDWMGGEIGFESREGKGSTFWFKVPILRSDETPSEAAGGAELDGVKVLVVDDTQTNRDILRQQLEGWGARVTAFDSAAIAIEAIRNANTAGQPFDAVVLDHLMPEISGLDLTVLLRSDPLTATLPLVMATSADLATLQPRLERLRIDEVLVKPVRQSALLNAMLRCLGRPPIDTPQTIVPAADFPIATTPLRILVAEDNAINQQVAVGLLAKLGHRADVADDGAEAVERVAAGEYDLVMMDMQMPHIDGLGATRLIRALPAPKAKVTIIAMTANAMSDDRDTCLAAGMDDYISKPIDLKRLTDMIARWDKHLQAARDERAVVPVDHAAMEDLRNALGKESFQALLDRFWATLPAALADLRRAAESGDSAALSASAHALAGAAGNLGFPLLCRRLLGLERRTPNDGPVGEEIEQIVALADLTRRTAIDDKI
ncbi:hybrid sensor histidine kinase/response regulator [Magnetospirillum molischianum]|uniref:Sensory/regulatory protein RpfC n=1 Tax=Magnetospirillum molischianum DSM 120 TaxID=1150626 RepID=H8FU08_MAGML|nr:hybrid sensor histidine kinase/response regulator [Magnetospirillum molischianum]CCG41846.1 Putative two-component sensor histidine kinase, unorthodox system [Magnetospirillum molischianum DSM 120]